jgi:hypothetical protein
MGHVPLGRETSFDAFVTALASKTMAQPPSDDELEPRSKSKRGAVVIFLLGWLVLPIAVMLLGELHSPWFEIGCVAMLAFIAVFIGAMVRVVRNF